jgi:hypothetical protein
MKSSECLFYPSRQASTCPIALIIIGRKRIIERLQCVAIANLMQRPIMVDN